MPKVKCEVCGKWFRDKKALEMHLIKSHGEDLSRPLQTSLDLTRKTEEALHTQSESKPVLSSPFESFDSYEIIEEKDKKEVSELDKAFARLFIANLNLNLPEVREVAREIAERYDVADYLEKLEKEKGG